jgi:hypothetical protein
LFLYYSYEDDVSLDSNRRFVEFFEIGDPNFTVKQLH